MLAVYVMPYAAENSTANSHIHNLCGERARSFHTTSKKMSNQKKNNCTDPKDAQEVWKVESSSQNSVAIEDNLTIPCMKYI